MYTSHFVPNITMGAPIISSLRPHTEAYFGKLASIYSIHVFLTRHLLDCHMMVSEPLKWIDDIAKAGGQMYCFHLEATNEPLKVIEKIHEAGMKAGVAIKPKTPAEAVMGEVAEAADMILVMTVEPGFGGQKFMAECMPKVYASRCTRRTI